MKAIQPIALDENFNILAFLYPTDIQWNREYYKCGDFSIQIPVEQYDNTMKYVYTKDRDEIGRISQVNYKQDETGYRYVQISGYFLENDLNEMIMYPAYWGHGDHVDDVIKDMVRVYYSAVDVADNSHAYTATNFNTDLGAPLGDTCYNILRLHECSYVVGYNFATGRRYFNVWRGEDRTEGSDFPVIFSTAFGNLKEPDVVLIDTDVKNWAVVAGKADQQDVYEVVDLSNGAPQKRIFISATGVEYDANNMTLAQYKQNLHDYGVQELKNSYSKKLNVEFDVLTDSYEYLEDFDLGDKCTVMIPELNLELSARIISIHEVGSKGDYKISIEFGDEIVVRS